MSRRLILALVLILSHAGFCLAATCVAPVPRDGSRLEITGVLFSVEKWGPPNFGERPETDARWTAWIIHLSAPLRIAGGARFAGKVWPTVSEIQVKMLLNELSDNALLSPYEGSLVVVKGDLFEASVISDVTPEVIGGEHVALADHATCRVLGGKDRSY
jgi:hypothetical protein